MASLCHLGFSQHGGWVLRGSIWRVSVLRPKQKLQTFSDLLQKSHNIVTVSYRFRVSHWGQPTSKGWGIIPHLSLGERPKNLPPSLIQHRPQTNDLEELRKSPVALWHWGRGKELRGKEVKLYTEVLLMRGNPSLLTSAPLNAGGGKLRNAESQYSFGIGGPRKPLPYFSLTQSDSKALSRNVEVLCQGRWAWDGLRVLHVRARHFQCSYKFKRLCSVNEGCSSFLQDYHQDTR